MSHVYRQSTGEFWLSDGLRSAIKGYSGHGEGLNNPSLQHVRTVGPIPRGMWAKGVVYDSAKTGKYTIPLYKVDNVPTDDIDDLTGRSAFRCHGDNSKGDKSASQGCIILPLTMRQVFYNSPDKLLLVIE